MNKTSVIIFGLVGILVVGAAGYFGFATTQAPPSTPPAPQTVSVTTCDVEQTVTAPGNLVNVNQAEVKMPADGKLSSVTVRVGDTVTAGQTLAELDPVTTTQAQVDLLEAQEALEVAQRHRTALDYPRATDEYIKDLKKQIKASKEAVSALNNSYKNEADPVLKSQLLVSLESAKADLKSLESKLAWYTSKPTESDVVNADSELALAQAKYDAAKAVLESLQIKAPFSGVVFAVTAESGATYSAETSLFTLGDPKALEIVANVTEEDYPLLALGQGVEIYFDARPELTIRGKVSRIIPQRIEGSDSPLYDIYITLDEVPDGLADGMTADTAITIASREGVLCLPRAVVRASASATTIVKVWDGVQETEREIKVGLRGDTYIEVVEGLSEGEQVVTR